MSKFKNAEELVKAYQELEKEFTKKSQKLAESEKKFYELGKSTLQDLICDGREIDKLKQQLAEKDKEIELVKNLNADERELKVIQKGNQDKIDYAVEQLNKAKYLITQEYRFDVEESDFAVAYEDDIDKIFDQLITEIKEGK